MLDVIQTQNDLVVLDFVSFFLAPALKVEDCSSWQLLLVQLTSNICCVAGSAILTGMLIFAFQFSL